RIRSMWSSAPICPSQGNVTSSSLPRLTRKRGADNMTRKMFGEVRMPRTETGKLFLHSMPGRYEPLDHTWEHVKTQTLDPAVPLSQVGVIILCAQHDFECAGTAHKAREMLGAACARDQAA